VLAAAGVSLAVCLIDSGRRIQEWLILRAPRVAFGTALGFCLWGLELFARVDTKIPFIYFQF
jgi:hypothetical protein